MSMDPSPSSGPAPAVTVPTAPAREAPAPVRSLSSWRGWLWAALGLAVLALLVSAALWQKLARTQEELVRRGADTQAEATAARTLAAQAEAQVSELQARVGVAEVRLSEVSLQRSQLEELMLSVSRTRDDSLVQDLESAVRLAVQQGQLTGSAQPLISSLQAAQQRIERAAQPRLNPVQRAMARDVERLRAAAALDTPALLARFDEALRQVDRVPLRNGPPAASGPGTDRAQEMPQPPDAQESSPDGSAVPAAPESPAGAADDSQEALPSESGPALAGFWARFQSWQGELWARWWGHLQSGASDLVRISRIDQPEAALLAPEQAYFLREHLKLWLLNARLGLLARQFDAARTDVQAAQGLVQRYFDLSAPQTRALLHALTRLHQDLRAEALPHPDDTLSALAVAASGR